MAWLARRPSSLARRLGLVHNPLRRPVDRLERVGVLVALAVVLAAIPISVVVGMVVERQSHAESVAETADRTLTTATLSRHVPEAAPSSPQVVPAAARWHAKDGVHTGYVPAAAGSPAGQRVPIWLDSSGNQVDQPLTRSQAQLQAILAGVCTMAGVLALLAVAAAIMSARLDRRRLSAWAAEWRQVEPEWTHRAG